VTAQPLDPAAVALIEHYLTGMAAALGPRDRTTHDLVDELRDGLLTTAEAWVAHGVPAADAARAAVRQCGALEQVTPIMRADAVATRARSTALAILAAGPLAAAPWAATLITSPASPWRMGHASPWGMVLPWLGFGVLLTLACALTAHAAVTRVGRQRPQLAQVTAVAAAVTCASTDLAGLALIASWALAGSGGIAWPAATAAAVVSAGRIVLDGDRVRRLRQVLLS
jgi:hypothetical protein